MSRIRQPDLTAAQPVNEHGKTRKEKWYNPWRESFSSSSTMIEIGWKGGTSPGQQ